jgi:hypothetical protein
VRYAVGVARTKEGRKLIAQARKVAASPDGRRLIKSVKALASQPAETGKGAGTATGLAAIRSRLHGRKP